MFQRAGLASRRRGLTTFTALWPELRSYLHEVYMPSFDVRSLDVNTLRILAELLEHRIDALDSLGGGGCPTCHEAQSRRFASSLRQLSERAAAEASAATNAA